MLVVTELYEFCTSSFQGDAAIWSRIVREAQVGSAVFPGLCRRLQSVSTRALSWKPDPQAAALKVRREGPFRARPGDGGWSWPALSALSPEQNSHGESLGPH